MRGDMTPREERVRARAQRLWQEAARCAAATLDRHAAGDEGEATAGHRGVICEVCHGTGFLADANPSQPCPSCGGVGFGYCCEGSDGLQGDDLVTKMIVDAVSQAAAEHTGEHAPGDIAAMQREWQEE